MTFTALAVVYLVICVRFGLARERRRSNALLAMSLAAAMTFVQLALLLTR